MAYASCEDAAPSLLPAVLFVIQFWDCVGTEHFIELSLTSSTEDQKKTILPWLRLMCARVQAIIVSALTSGTKLIWGIIWGVFPSRPTERG
jgi:hypothetical protein